MKLENYFRRFGIRNGSGAESSVSAVHLHYCRSADRLRPEHHRRSRNTGTAWFFSRSRQKLWNKGETSGNFIFVSRILSDCDDDTLIYVGTPKGPVCHTGHRTCFFTTLWEKPEEK